MIQKSFHRIFTGSRAFTRRPRRPRRQLPRFSSLVLHVFARGVLPDHDSRPRSFARSTRETARTNPRLARAFVSPLDGPSSSARARVCHPPRPGTRAAFPSNPAPRPVAGARRSLFPEISRRFSHFFSRFRDAFSRFLPRRRDAFSRFIVLYRASTRSGWRFFSSGFHRGPTG